MTAVIGILNKSGVALAADSAVTITGNNGRKIYNTAYKIFTLSKYHPVSIMLYNSASFMGIPWEVLIKEYRKLLGEKSYDSLKEYQDNFLVYLKKNINLISTQSQIATVESFIEFFLKKIIEDTTNENIYDIEKTKTIKKKKEIIEIKIKEKIESLVSSYQKDILLDDFKDYKFDSFRKKYSKKLNESFNKFYIELNISSITKNKLFRIIHHLIIADYFLGSWTGLVFTGFGEKEIYPMCFPLKIGEVIDNRIRYVIDNDNVTKIDDSNPSTILPFAQRDVIDTILSGIDSNLEDTVYESFEIFLSSFLTLFREKIGEENNDLKDKINNINVKDLISGYSENFQKLKYDKHIYPLMSSIASLSKEDLADLAESLIYLTYLKRRMSFSEESVGGPIDVAIITKGDGFVWIKRKHYFNKELNQDFMYKYLKR